MLDEEMGEESHLPDVGQGSFDLEPGPTQPGSVAGCAACIIRALGLAL